MKEFDIEGYIEGTLSKEDLQAIKTEISQNANFADEVAMQQLLHNDLNKLALSKKIKLELAEDTRPKSSGFPTWLLALGGMALITIFIFLQSSENTPPPQIENPNSNTTIQTQIPEQSTPPAQTEENLPPKKEKTVSPPPQKKEKTVKKNRPIAQDVNPKTLNPPLYPSPNVRGTNEDDSAWKAFLDKIWYTEYPPNATKIAAPFEEIDSLLAKRNFSDAYVSLLLMESNQAKNDTFRFLNAYCLLEMGEGAEAQRYLENLEGNQPNWKAQIEWYRGLSFLISGKQEEAITIFKKISNLSNHPFRQQAKKALELLE